MSRGPGRIMREVRRLLEAEPDRLWTIEKLARAIYGEAQKRHRVSVGRALPRVAKEIDWACVTYRGFHRGPPPLVWYNRRSFAAWRETHPYAPEEQMRAMF